MVSTRYVRWQRYQVSTCKPRPSASLRFLEAGYWVSTPAHPKVVVPRQTKTYKMAQHQQKPPTRLMHITQIIRKQFFCVTNVRVIGKLIPKQLICVIGTFTESTLWRPRITQNNSCQKALCNRCPVQLGNWFLKRMRVIILGHMVASFSIN